MKNFISILDTEKKDVETVLDLAEGMKDKTDPPRGMTAALLFNMPSTRTLVSFDVTLAQLGMTSAHLNYVFTQMIRGEQIGDTSRALSQYAAAIIARLSDHSIMQELAKNSTVPVINAGTPLEHPCQALGDLYTMKSRQKLKHGSHMVLVGDPSYNVANSLLVAASMFGMSITVLSPKGYGPLKNYLAAAEKNTKVTLTSDTGCLKDADIIYASGWVREVPEQESPTHMKAFLPYLVDEAMLKKAPSDVLVMHPLPAFRGLEISDAVIDGKNSIVWEQTKNRVYVQKALLKMLLKL